MRLLAFKQFFSSFIFSRMFDINEGMTSSGPEDESQTVRDVVRQLVRDVLKAEKEQLRLTLEQRRRHRNTPGTPV